MGAEMGRGSMEGSGRATRVLDSWESDERGRGVHEEVWVEDAITEAQCGAPSGVVGGGTAGVAVTSSFISPVQENFDVGGADVALTKAHGWEFAGKCYSDRLGRSR